MKLSHAVLRMRTAIAELRHAIGVGSGALLGVMVTFSNLSGSIHVSRIKGLDYVSDGHILFFSCNDKCIMRVPDIIKNIVILDLDRKNNARSAICEQVKNALANRQFLIYQEWIRPIWSASNTIQMAAVKSGGICGAKKGTENEYINAVNECWRLSCIMHFRVDANMIFRIWQTKGWLLNAYPSSLIKNELPAHNSPLATSNQYKDQPSEYANDFNPRFPSLYEWFMFFGGAWCIAWGWISLQRNRNGDWAGYAFFVGIVLFFWGMIYVLPWIAL
jgi:hypothetical protein